MTNFGTVAWLAPLVLPLFAAAAGAGEFSLEKIQGGEQVRLTRAGKELRARAGDTVEVGDLVRTSDGQRATILYADGTRLDVLPSSELRLVPKGEDGSQAQELIQGAVRGVVTRGPAGAAARPKHRFTLRSRAAVMGVRGTDFVMTLVTGAEKATVHVIEGTVDVAADAGALAAGKATPVQAGAFVEATPAGVGVPQAFDPAKFLGDVGYTPSASADAGASAPSAVAAGADKAEKPQAEPQAEPKKDEPKKDEPKAAADEPSGSRRIRFLSFRGGYVTAGKIDGRKVDGPSLAWSPVVPVPFIPFLWVRGHLGFAQFKDPSQGDRMTVPEVGALASVQLFNRLLAEVGPVHQNWERFETEGPAAQANVGILPMPDGLIHSIFVGRTWYRHNRDGVETTLHQWRIGIGIQF